MLSVVDMLALTAAQDLPKPLQAFVPYIYSRDELRRLLDAIVAIDNPRSNIDQTPSARFYWCYMAPASH